MTTMTMTARATIWLLQPLADEGICSYGLFLSVAGRWFICPETFGTKAEAEAAVRAVREGLR